MNLPQQIDHLGLWVGYIIPAYVVLRFRRGLVTVPLAILILWFGAYLHDSLFSTLSGHALDRFWLYVDAVSGALYVLLLYGLRGLCILIFRIWTLPRTASQHAL